MAITIDWPTQVINVPRNDMLLVQSVPTEIRELDLDAFRLELKSIEASIEGIPFLDTHSHNPPVTVGGVTLARVVEIINGYTVTFEDGQYAVNLVGANSNVGDVTNVNQVSVRSANSAGLTYSKEVEDQSFEDARVWVDFTDGSAGTQFPRGTPGDPVNNIADAQSIIASRGLPKRLHITGNADISEDLSNYDIVSDSAVLTTLTFVSPSNSDSLSIAGVTVTGNLSGHITAHNRCIFDSVTNLDGEIYNSGFRGTCTVSSDIKLIHSFSDVAGSLATPIFDCQGLDNLDLSIRGWDGGITITNYSGANNKCSVDMDAGRVILDSSVSDGNIAVRGTGYIVDGSTGGTVSITGLTYGTSGLTAEESTQLASIDTLRKLMQNRMETDPTTGVLTIYDDDDITPFLTGSIYEDVLASQIYRGRGIERRDRLT